MWPGGPPAVQAEGRVRMCTTKWKIRATNKWDRPTAGSMHQINGKRGAEGEKKLRANTISLARTSEFSAAANNVVAGSLRVK